MKLELFCLNAVSQRETWHLIGKENVANCILKEEEHFISFRRILWQFPV